MNYSEIIALSLGDTDRESDAKLLTLIDSKLRLVEARINRFLLIQDQLLKTTITMDAATEFYGPPLQYSAIKNIFINPISAPTNRTTLQYLAPEQINNAIQNNRAAFNEYYSIVGNQVQVYPLRDNTYELHLWYFANVTPLTSIDSTNWCSLKNPDCYVSGLCAEICAYARDADGFTFWNGRFEASLESIDLQDWSVSWSGTPLVQRVG